VRTTLARIGGTIAVLLGFLLPTLAATGASAAPAAHCVGVIVDSGQGRPGTGCVAYAKGLTGQQALQKAGHKLGFASNGILCQIDGYPAACKSDNTHYWAYDIRKAGADPSAWGYATQGPGTQKVKAGETDGFVYVNGKDRKPAAIAYDTIAANSRPSAAASSSSTPGSTRSTSKPAAKGSSHTGLIIGIVVVVVLLAAAGTQLALRRRRA
jgi:hypothetical protein